jgi:hypothetical protein
MYHVLSEIIQFTLASQSQARRHLVFCQRYYNLIFGRPWQETMRKGTMKKRLTLATLALLTALLVLLFTATSAFAHEKRHVGNYTFVVGFLDEPAYANFKNGLDLTICNGAECNYTVEEGSRVVSNPVNDAQKTLKAEVSMGGSAPIALTLDAAWRAPGKYEAYFQPTKTGAYTFHIFGTLDNNKIDEKFTSSPTGFSAVEQVQAYPSVSSASPVSSDSTAGTAMILGIVGTVLGALGLAVAGFVLVRKPKLAQASDTGTKAPAESLGG